MFLYSPMCVQCASNVRPMCVQCASNERPVGIRGADLSNKKERVCARVIYLFRGKFMESITVGGKNPAPLGSPESLSLVLPYLILLVFRAVLVRGFEWKKSCTTWPVSTLNTGVRGDAACLKRFRSRLIEVVQDFFHPPSQKSSFAMMY